MYSRRKFLSLFYCIEPECTIHAYVCIYVVLRVLSHLSLSTYLVNKRPGIIKQHKDCGFIRTFMV